MIKQITILLFINLSVQSFAQDSLKIERSIPRIFFDDTKILLSDFFSFYTEPVRFSSTEWLYAAGILGGTALLISADQEVTNGVGRQTIGTLNNDFWDIPTRYGIITYATVFSVSTYTAGLLIGSDDIRVTGRLLFEALTISGLGIMATRYVAGRVRPYYKEGEWAFRWFQSDNEYQSFPSGHTCVAFALSTVLAERIDNIWARIGFYGMAGLTATARVINNQHFLSDVLWGALFGFGAGIYVVNREGENFLKNISIYPNYNGVGVVYSF